MSTINILNQDFSYDNTRVNVEGSDGNWEIFGFKDPVENLMLQIEENTQQVVSEEINNLKL